jgi:hypothetical protein
VLAPAGRCSSMPFIWLFERLCCAWFAVARWFSTTRVLSLSSKASKNTCTVAHTSVVLAFCQKRRAGKLYSHLFQLFVRKVFSENMIAGKICLSRESKYHEDYVQKKIKESIGFMI